MSTGKKYRHEYKYLMTDAQSLLIINRLKGLMTIDSHVGHSGQYCISSLYFDDYYNSCLYENIGGTDPREKFRIRIYNHNAELITLECKRKEHEKTLKTSCRLTREQCETIIKGQYIRDIDEQPPLLKKFTLKMMTHKLSPIIIVEYDRIPYVYHNGNVRVTFDRNLSSSNNTDRFLDVFAHKRPVMPRGLNLMEVKWDEYLPDVIYRALQIENLRRTAYSKYYLCRKYTF